MFCWAPRSLRGDHVHSLGDREVFFSASIFLLMSLRVAMFMLSCSHLLDANYAWKTRKFRQGIAHLLVERVPDDVLFLVSARISGYFRSTKATSAVHMTHLVNRDCIQKAPGAE